MTPEHGTGRITDWKKTERTIPSPVRTFLKVLVSLGLLTWLAVQSSWSSTIQALRALPWFVALFGFLFFGLGQLFASYRMQRLLASQGIHVNYFYTLRLTFAGLFAGNFLPSTVGGDAIKVFLLAKDDHGKSTPTSVVIMDRIINLVAMTLLLPTLFTVPTLWNSNIIKAAGLSVTFIALGVLILAVTAYFLRQYLLKRADHGPLHGRVYKNLQRLADFFVVCASFWKGKPTLLVLALCLSWASVVSSLYAGWIAAQGLNINIGFAQLTAVLLLVYFVSLVPISFNGLGVQELSVVYLLCRLETSPVSALALAILIRFFYIGVSLPGLFWVFGWKKPEDRE
jgi:uncharacterized protein (TIRG00374 family)